MSGGASSPAPIRFVLDTNLWIGYGRDAETRRELRAFVTAKRGRVWMLSVVAQELAAGALTTGRRRDLEETLAPFERQGRVLSLSYAAEREVGRVMATLAERERFGPTNFTAAFANDVRIAAACREHGAALVTRNVSDFLAVQRHLAGFRFFQPWPERIGGLTRHSPNAPPPRAGARRTVPPPPPAPGACSPAAAVGRWRRR